MEDYQTSIGVILKMGASAEAAAEVPGLLDFPICSANRTKST